MKIFYLKNVLLNISKKGKQKIWNDDENMENYFDVNMKRSHEQMMVMWSRCRGFRGAKYYIKIRNNCISITNSSKKSDFFYRKYAKKNLK